VTAECPTPHKIGFPSQRDARDHIHAWQMDAEPYRCACDMWHLRTPQPPQQKPGTRRALLAAHFNAEHLLAPVRGCQECAREQHRSPR
jgi:hypothetical protein